MFSKAWATFAVNLLFFISIAAKAQTASITGKVIDTAGAPVAGVSIQLKTGRQITLSDSAGMFNVYARPGTVFLLSAPGFASTSITIDSNTVLQVVLKPYISPLFRAETAEMPTSAKKDSLELAQYYSQLKINSFNHLQSNTQTASPQFSSVTSSDDLYQGGSGMVEQFVVKEGLRGSRYLFNKWVTATVINSNGQPAQKPNAFYNYDKINGSLLMTQDMVTVLTIKKSKIQSFTLKGDTISITFVHVPAINDSSFFVSVAATDKYEIYKQLTCRFEKSNFVSNGLTESGHNYDEYVDDSLWYILDVKANIGHPFKLTRKSLKEALPAEEKNISVYFSHHADAELDETFLIGLVEYLNQ